jgi:hypothetical protein
MATFCQRVLASASKSVSRSLDRAGADIPGARMQELARDAARTHDGGDALLDVKAHVVGAFRDDGCSAAG